MHGHSTNYLPRAVFDVSLNGGASCRARHAAVPPFRVGLRKTNRAPDPCSKPLRRSVGQLGRHAVARYLTGTAAAALSFPLLHLLHMTPPVSAMALICSSAPIITPMVRRRRTVDPGSLISTPAGGRCGLPPSVTLGSVCASPLAITYERTLSWYARGCARAAQRPNAKSVASCDCGGGGYDTSYIQAGDRCTTGKWSGRKISCSVAGRQRRPEAQCEEERVPVLLVLKPGATVEIGELCDHTEWLIAGYRRRAASRCGRAAAVRCGQGPQARAAGEALGRHGTRGELT